MYASKIFVVRLQTLTTMDPKDSKETSIKVEPDAARSTNTLKKSCSRRARSGRSSKKLGGIDTTSAPSSQPRFLGSCEGINGHIFDIGPTRADRYIKTKKDLVGYAGRTYSNHTKKSIETLTYKLTSIVGTSMPTKKITDTNMNMEITVDKLEADLTYLEKLDINEETRSYNKEKCEYKKEMLQEYYIIHAQCTDDMIQDLQVYSPYEAVSDASESAKLLKLIKLIYHTYQMKTHKHMALVR